MTKSTGKGRGHNEVRRNDAQRKAQMEALITSLRDGARVTDACAKAGITRWAFYDWKRRFPEFAASAEAAIASQIGIVEDALFTRAVNGSDTAAIFFLCNRAADRWRTVTNIQHGGMVGNPVQIAAAASLMAGMTDDQLRKIADAAAPAALEPPTPDADGSSGAPTAGSESSATPPPVLKEQDGGSAAGPVAGA